MRTNGVDMHTSGRRAQKALFETGCDYLRLVLLSVLSVNTCMLVICCCSHQIYGFVFIVIASALINEATFLGDGYFNGTVNLSLEVHANSR